MAGVVMVIEVVAVVLWLLAVMALGVAAMDPDSDLPYAVGFALLAILLFALPFGIVAGIESTQSSPAESER